MVFGLAAFVFAGVIFVIDTFTSIEGAIAVLYAIALMLGAQVLSRTAIIGITALFIGLALLSFGVTHDPLSDAPTALRLVVSIAALIVTCGLLLRADTARQDLIVAIIALRESEARYRAIFDRTRVALWERDYSQLREFLVGLRVAGVTDVKTYARSRPDFASKCYEMIKFVAANEAAVELVGSSTSSSIGAFEVGYFEY